MNLILTWRNTWLEGEAKKKNGVKHAASVNPSSAAMWFRAALVQAERNWSEVKSVVCWRGCAWEKDVEDRIPAGKSHHRRDGITFLSLIPKTILWSFRAWQWLLLAMDSNNAQLSIRVPAGWGAYIFKESWWKFWFRVFWNPWNWKLEVQAVAWFPWTRPLFLPGNFIPMELGDFTYLSRISSIWCLAGAVALPACLWRGLLVLLCDCAAPGQTGPPGIPGQAVCARWCGWPDACQELVLQSTQFTSGTSAEAQQTCCRWVTASSSAVPVKIRSDAAPRDPAYPWESKTSISRGTAWCSGVTESVRVWGGPGLIFS